MGTSDVQVPTDEPVEYEEEVDPGRLALGVSPPQDTSYQAYVEFMSGVHALLDQYWAQVLAQANIQWQPVAGVYGYDASNPSTWRYCDGRPLNSPRNAFYCFPSDEIVLEEPTMLYFNYVNVGDASAAAIFAHEFGHALQSQRRLNWEQASPYNKEQQADCFAGAWLKWMEEQGRIEPGDLEEIEQIIYATGDVRPDRMVLPDGHGNFAERAAAYNAGLANGPSVCIA